MYKRGIERILTSAGPVWYTWKVTILRKLQAIQRLPLLMMTKAFKTASNLPLTIVAKISPVYPTIEKEIEELGVIKEGKTFSCDDKLYTSNQIMKKYDFWTDHPANKSGIVITPVKEIVDYRIYTDGSKTTKEVGAAFVIFTITEEPNNK